MINGFTNMQIIGGLIAALLASYFGFWRMAVAVRHFGEPPITGIDANLSAIERKLVVLGWMVGILTAVVPAIGLPALWLLIRIATKVGVGF